MLLRGGTTDTIRWSNAVGSRASARQHEPGTNPPTVTPLSTDMLEFIALLQTTSKKISPFCHHKSVVTSLTQWTRVWPNSGRYWKTGKPGALWSLGLQRVRQDLVTKQQWSAIHCKLHERESNHSGIDYMKKQLPMKQFKQSFLTFYFPFSFDVFLLILALEVILCP